MRGAETEIAPVSLVVAPQGVVSTDNLEIAMLPDCLFGKLHKSFIAQVKHPLRKTRFRILNQANSYAVRAGMIDFLKCQIRS